MVRFCGSDLWFSVFMVQRFAPPAPGACRAAFDMAAPSVRSTGSGSKSSAPTTVDGSVPEGETMPDARQQNIDCNAFSSGKWGPEFSKFLIWHRGSSQNPDGKFERSVF